MKEYESAQLLNPNSLPEEGSGLEYSLRPKTLDEFIGQQKLKDNLKVFVEAAKRRREALDHCLFYSPPGLGKTTLAFIMAREMGVSLKTTSGPILERVGDLAAMLTDLSEGDVFFIDEIHRLNHIVEEALYPVMEDFNFYINTGRGPAATTVKLSIPRFTLIGATTRSGLLTGPLRDRFGIIGNLNFYETPELERIVVRSAQILNIEVEPSGVEEIARRSRGTPRIANRLLRRLRDFAEVQGRGVITQAIAQSALNALEVDPEGLDAMDRRLLAALIEKFRGGPVGIENLAIAVGEEIDSLTDVYEPYLIQSGFLQRTFRGRVATPKAYKHLRLELPAKPEDLF
ncbi:MAG: Holliday junction DNA helicase RuvB [Elusimicrobia bacterium RIFCSPLOWO2_12_FULL_59_9]|nr:MAG: Holliday junction DNA helicase RuvB [Elusimicrobia bacterium RIFCSPLOWO2_12_FULL_59_9]